MIPRIDPLNLKKNRKNFNLTYVREGSYGPAKIVWKLKKVPDMTKRLIRDLNLKDLGEICTGGNGFSEGFAYILANPFTDPKQIIEQRKAIKELTGPGQYTLDTIVDSLHKLGRQKIAAEEDIYVFPGSGIDTKLNLLSTYNELLNFFENRFEDSESVPLKSIADYVKQLRKLPEAFFIPETVEKGENHLILNLEITRNVAGIEREHNLRFVRTKFGRRIPGLRILRHLGHRIKAGVLFMAPYRWKVNSALKQLIKHNEPHIKETLSLLPAFEFYRAAINYEKLLDSKKDKKTMANLSSNGSTSLKEIEHPVFSLNGKKSVPNDYSDDKRVLLITGANNGGKTYYSKLVGIQQLLFQRGLSNTAKDANLSIADKVYTHFIEQDDPIRGQGRYQFELRRMEEILGKCTGKSLIIVDEPCGGTDPAKGKIQSSYFLEALHETGARIIFNTHYHDLADMEKELASVKNIHPDTRFKDGKLIFKYKMLEDPAGTSYALELAQSMDLGRESLLKKAKKANERT